MRPMPCSANRKSSEPHSHFCQSDRVYKLLNSFLGHIAGKYLSIVNSLKQSSKMKSVLFHMAPFPKVENGILKLNFCLRLRLEDVSWDSYSTRSHQRTNPDF